MISAWFLLPTVLFGFVIGHYLGVARGLRTMRVLTLAVRDLMDNGRTAAVYNLLDAAETISPATSAKVLGPPADKN